MPARQDIPSPKATPGTSSCRGPLLELRRSPGLEEPLQTSTACTGCAEALVTHRRSDKDAQRCEREFGIRVPSRVSGFDAATNNTPMPAPEHQCNRSNPLPTSGWHLPPDGQICSGACIFDCLCCSVHWVTTVQHARVCTRAGLLRFRSARNVLPNTCAEKPMPQLCANVLHRDLNIIARQHDGRRRH